MGKASTKRIKVTSECNQNCIFCDGNAGSDPKLYSKKQVELQILKRKGLRRLNITGGEPTICDNLGGYLRLAKKTGYRDIAILTNANRFSDRAYASRMKKSGLTEAIVSVYHYDPGISDKISKVRGSFQRKKEGITNLRNLGVKVTVNIVIFSGNYTAIPKLVEFLHSSLDVRFFAFSFLEPNCTRVAARPELVPDLQKSLTYLKKAVEYCKKNKLKYFIPYNGAIPPCIFEINKLSVIKPEKIIGADFNPSGLYGQACQFCAERQYCKGFLKEYFVQCLDILKKGLNEKRIPRRKHKKSHN